MNKTFFSALIGIIMSQSSDPKLSQVGAAIVGGSVGAYLLSSEGG